MTTTLRDRLHEFFHVGTRDTWTCDGIVEDCQLVKTVTSMERLISHWMRDQSDTQDRMVAVASCILASRVEEGSA